MDSRFLKSSIWYTIANFMTKGIGIITTPIFARFLTHEEYGLYANYSSWKIVFTTIISLNLGSTFITARFDYNNRFNEYTYSVLALSLFSSLMWMVVLNLLSAYTDEFFGISNLYINCLLVSILFSAIIDLFQIRERYLYHYKASVFLSFAVAVTSAILSVILVITMKDKLLGRVVGEIIPIILIGSAVLIYIKCIGKKVDLSCWEYAFPICLPFIPHLLSLSVLNSFDKVMITNICGPEDNALYSLAYTCGMAVSILVTSMNNAFSPWLGEKLHGGEFREIQLFSKKYIGVFSAMAIGMMFVSPEIIYVLGGKSYLPAKYVMPPVMFGCVCQFLYMMFVSVEQFKKKTVWMAVASISAAILNVILNYMFIPRYGYIAAAYTTLVSYVWLLAMHMLIVKVIGYQVVYDYKYIVLVLLLFCLITLAVNLLYKFTSVRYMLLFAYVITVLIVLFINRKLIINALLKKDV